VYRFHLCSYVGIQMDRRVLCFDKNMFSFYLNPMMERKAKVVCVVCSPKEYKTLPYLILGASSSMVLEMIRDS
jgi:hypothetical protein